MEGSLHCSFCSDPPKNMAASAEHSLALDPMGKYVNGNLF